MKGSIKRTAGTFDNMLEAMMMTTTNKAHPAGEARSTFLKIALII